jgi:hypothetical protein
VLIRRSHALLGRRFRSSAAAAPSTRVPPTAPQPALRPRRSLPAAVLDVFELVASAKVRFRSRLCIFGRLGQQRDLVLLDEAEPHAVAVQLTLLAQGDPGQRGAREVILMPERSMEPYLWSGAVVNARLRWKVCGGTHLLVTDARADEVGCARGAQPHLGLGARTVSPTTR